MSSFVDASFLSRLGQITESQANEENFGIVKVDDSGKILIYNQFESNLANVPIEKAVGKNFFTDIAICTNNRLFYGKFREGVAKGQLDVSFSYVFTYKMKPTNVQIHLYHDPSSKTYWIFVKPK
ncbi:photoactive yellow protein [Leptospira ryugenii]|uniref:Photoactive yellow protein n=1 Tax=Leptospira ryugenii TaxID=1917863 RepID=A0A2P2DXI2_9LEPT|nr:photoactive yellow protein [Leptospira ryugenii]GBF49343.1 photoactive yellow protein [Leptospira ryugenii]